LPNTFLCRFLWKHRAKHSHFNHQRPTAGGYFNGLHLGHCLWNHQ
jgi:hypothetical protein